MATKADEFDPSADVLDALVGKVLVAILTELSTEVPVPYLAKIDVFVREESFPKFSLSNKGIGDYNIEENTLARIRFRRTYRENRILFSIETQHADEWRRTGFSGIRCHGDILIDDSGISPKSKSKTICYNSGWLGW